MSERRKQRRIPVPQLMEARITLPGSVSRGRVIDLNNAGAFIATELELDKNSPLRVELLIPGGAKSVPLKAVVARRMEAIEGVTRTIPAGLGVVFLTDNVMERAFIQMAVLEALKVSLAMMRMRLDFDPRSRHSVS